MFTCNGQLIEGEKVSYAFLAKTKTITMVSKTASVLWSNSIVKRHEAALCKILGNITYKHKTEVWNAPIFSLMALLPLDLNTEVHKQIEPSPPSEAVKKAISF